MTIGGGCACGAVRLEITAEPISARQCWCRFCQYIGAGSGTVNVVFPAEAVTATGELAWYETVADSGTPMRRGFCPACGTPIFTLATTRPHLTIIRAGALDNPEIGAPQTLIWTDSAPSWAHLDPALPHIPGQPPAPAAPPAQDA